jgi:hypothetical protein
MPTPRPKAGAFLLSWHSFPASARIVLLPGLYANSCTICTIEIRGIVSAFRTVSSLNFYPSPHREATFNHANGLPWHLSKPLVEKEHVVKKQESAQSRFRQTSMGRGQQSASTLATASTLTTSSEAGTATSPHSRPCAAEPRPLQPRSTRTADHGMGERRSRRHLRLPGQ